MTRNYTNQTLVVAKFLLSDALESLGSWQESLEEASDKYIGKALDDKIKSSKKFIEEYQITVWALEDFIKDLEAQDQMAKDHEAGKI